MSRYWKQVFLGASVVFMLIAIRQHDMAKRDLGVIAVSLWTISLSFHREKQ